LNGANVLYRKGFDKKQFIKIKSKKEAPKKRFLRSFFLLSAAISARIFAIIRARAIC